MRFCTIFYQGREQAAVGFNGGVLPLAEVNRVAEADFPTELLAFIEADRLAHLKETIETGGAFAVMAEEEVEFRPPYRNPRKLWGIGLNYQEHAADLNEKSPTDEPASFMKPHTTIIGPGDSIILPPQSRRVTAEAELGLVFGKVCKDVEETNARSVLFGYTTIIDMTAEDILRKNPRFLTRAKSFDTFFSFGPWVTTVDELPRDLGPVRVSTVLNGEVKATNTIDHMTFSPDFLVSFHSKVMTFYPGDIISSGTPGAVPIEDGDLVECRIDVPAFGVLRNKVVRP